MIPQKPTLIASSLLAASFLLRATEAVAQTTMPPRTNWVVGSDELIRIALTNNLSIQISQIQPQIDQYALKGLYGVYEPLFDRERDAYLQFLSSRRLHQRLD